jgi:hypothetical protein
MALIYNNVETVTTGRLPYFYSFSIRKNAQNRNQSTVAEIRRFQSVAGLMQQVVSLQPDEFQFREQHFAFFGREVEQNLVMDMVSVTVVEGRLQGRIL